MLTPICMFIGAVMSITVQTKNSVTLTGEVPEDVTASYRCTYQKGDIRANDTASLVVNGWGGEHLDHVVLHMRSNKSDGAGIIRVAVDDEEAVRKQGTYKDWTGNYSTTSQPINIAVGRDVDNALQIDIIGTKNSLHIEKYELYYSPAMQEPYTVTLYTPDGSEQISELEAGAGIVLPQEEDKNGWYFVGWSEGEVAQDVTCPKIYAPGTIFHPKQDTELWSIYCNRSNRNERKVYRMESGHYILSYVTRNKSMCGVCSPRNTIETTDTEFGTDAEGVFIPSSSIQANCVYALAVDSLRGKCTIQHAESHTYIGIANGNFHSSPTEWDYVCNADTTWTISYLEGGYRYVLYMDYQSYTVRIARQLVGSSADPDIKMWSLFRAADPNVPTRWTTQPMLLADEAPQADRQAIWLDMGIWKMRIINGKKQIYLHR